MKSRQMALKSQMTALNEDMIVKYTGESDVSLTNGKSYEIISIESGLYRIIDDTGEDYLFYPEEFEIIEK